MNHSPSFRRSSLRFILAASSLVLTACFEAGTEEEFAQVEQHHPGHNNPFINGTYKAGYAVEFPDASGSWWAKHSMYHPVLALPSGWISSRGARPGVVCESPGVYGAVTCRPAERLALVGAYVAALRGQPYWSGFTASQITTLLERHSVFSNHYSHPDAAGNDANNAMIVRFDLPQSLRNRSSYTLRAELDLAIPNQTACTNSAGDGVPHARMEVYALMSTSQSTWTNWYHMGLGATYKDVGVWNASTSTCTVSAPITLTRPSGSYPWFFKVTAIGGLGHLPAPLKVRLE